jgi:hypothetical protein
VAMIFDFFNEVLASPPAHSHRIKFKVLGLPSLDRLAMSARFPEEEVWSVIKGLPPDKVPGPDGFMTQFFQVMWPVIRHNVMSTFDALWRLDMRHWHNTDDALMVLLPKSIDAETMSDYWPITLIHSIGKLIAKVLVNKHAPRLSELVHVSQNAFIEGRFIHDSFKLIQASTKQLHARKVPSLLLKVDIARAFDLVSWPFLLQIMQVVDFSSGWRDWVSALLSSASIKVMLNDMPEERGCHARSLRQGYPLSPMLFLLVMEVLSAMFRWADGWSLPKPLGARPIPHYISLYVDDMVLFVALRQQDLHLVRDILQIIKGASGLGCNVAKCQLAPIRCSEE